MRSERNEASESIAEKRAIAHFSYVSVSKADTARTPSHEHPAKNAAVLKPPVFYGYISALRNT